MSSKTFRDALLSMIAIANDRARLPERIVKSTIDSVNALTAREWIYFTGQELRTLPAGISVDPMGDLRCAADAQAPVVVDFPKITLAQEATIHRLLLQAAGVEVTVIKEYPATANAAVTTREFALANLPLFTDNFAIRLTFQPGAVLQGLGVLYEINV